MRILVTGGAGFIGSNLIHFLIGEKHEVLNIDKLTYAGNLASLEGVADARGYRFSQTDICNISAIRALFASFQPDAVMHLAAESHVDRSIDAPMDFVQTNVVGTATLLQIALEYWKSSKINGFRFLHVSTDEVYGSLTPEDNAFTETTPYSPHSPYSASKAASDHLVRAWHDTYGFPILITNCSNNYGPYQFPEKLIPVVILKALRGESIPIYGQGKNIRDWLYVGDHVRALHTVVQNGRLGETYNIGGDNEMENIQLVRLLCELLDELTPRADGLSYKSQIEFVADRPGHDLRYGINATKIRTQLGWHPLQNQHSGFRETVRWYLQNQSWWQPILDGTYQLQRLGSNSLS